MSSWRFSLTFIAICGFVQAANQSDVLNCHSTKEKVPFAQKTGKRPVYVNNGFPIDNLNVLVGRTNCRKKNLFTLFYFSKYIVCLLNFLSSADVNHTFLLTKS
jgi:hypothetical protein